MSDVALFNAPFFYVSLVQLVNCSILSCGGECNVFPSDGGVRNAP